MRGKTIRKRRQSDHRELANKTLRSISNRHATNGMTEFMDCTSSQKMNEKQGPADYSRRRQQCGDYRDSMVLYEKQ